MAQPLLSAKLLLFLKKCTEGGLPVLDAFTLLKTIIVLCSRGWSVTCPLAHCPVKQNMSKHPNLHKKPFSVALLGRDVLWQDSKPPQLPNSEHQIHVDIWTVAGPACSEKMAKSGLGELSLTMLPFFYIFNCSRRVCILNSREKLLN